jgi:hypothetical protein
MANHNLKLFVWINVLGGGTAFAIAENKADAAEQIALDYRGKPKVEVLRNISKVEPKVHKLDKKVGYSIWGDYYG